MLQPLFALALPRFVTFPFSLKFNFILSFIYTIVIYIDNNLTATKYKTRIWVSNDASQQQFKIRITFLKSIFISWQPASQKYKLDIVQL